MLKVGGKKVFLFGYYGRNNIGDEIMLQNLLKIFDDSKVKEVCLLSASNTVDVNLNNTKLTVLKGIKNKPFLFLWSLISSDIFIWGGGTCFFERTNRRGLWEIYMFFLIRKLFFNTNNYFLGIGLEPLDKSKTLIYRILKLTRGVIYRDQVSFDLHKKYFDNIQLKFLKKFDDLVIHNLTLSLINTNERIVDNDLEAYITFSGHFKYDKEMAKHVASELLKYVLKHNLKILFLPAKFGEFESDVNFHELVKNELQEKGFFNLVHNVEINSLNQFCMYLRKSKFHFGMRLHSLILADIYGIPNLALAYQNKIYQYNPNACSPQSNWSDNIIKSTDFTKIQDRLSINTKDYEGFIN